MEDANNTVHPEGQATTPKTVTKPNTDQSALPTNFDVAPEMIHLAIEDLEMVQVCDFINFF